MQCKTSAINQKTTHFSFPILRGTFREPSLCPPSSVHPGTIGTPGARVDTLVGCITLFKNGCDKHIKTAIFSLIKSHDICCKNHHRYLILSPISRWPYIYVNTVRI